MLPRKLSPLRQSLSEPDFPSLSDQGQGGGQAVEDAEALQVVLPLGTAAAAIPERLELAEKIRYERASLIQGYSREKALGPRPGEKASRLLSVETEDEADLGSPSIFFFLTSQTVNAQEYAFYNFGYKGAKEWAEKQGIEL